MTRRAARAALVATLVVGASHRVLGQTASTTLTVTGGSTTTFPTPTLANYLAGYIDGPTITFTVTTVNGGSQPRTTTVEICATAATLGGGKSIGDLQWQPSDGSKPFQSMQTGCGGAIDNARVVDAQAIARGNSWNGGVKLRLLLNWTDAASSYGTNVELALSVTP